MGVSHPCAVYFLSNPARSSCVWLFHLFDRPSIPVESFLLSHVSRLPSVGRMSKSIFIYLPSHVKQIPEFPANIRVCGGILFLIYFWIFPCLHQTVKDYHGIIQGLEVSGYTSPVVRSRHSMGIGIRMTLCTGSLRLPVVQTISSHRCARSSVKLPTFFTARLPRCFPELAWLRHSQEAFALSRPLASIGPQVPALCPASVADL